MAMKSSPRSPLEKACVQQQIPNAAKNKVNKFKKNKQTKILLSGMDTDQNPLGLCL